MNQHFRECSRTEVAQTVYDQLLAAVNQLGIPSSSYGLAYGKEPTDPIGRYLTHICVRFIPAKSDSPNPDERHVTPFDSRDDFVCYFPGDGWELLEVFAYMIATTYPIGGLMAVGVGYRDTRFDDHQNELWLGFPQPL